MRRIQISHKTRYSFAGRVALGPHRLMLRPREGHNLLVESSKLQIEPAAVLRWHSDAFDNSIAVASFALPASELIIASQVVVQHYDDTPFDFIVADHAVDYPFFYSQSEAAILAPYRARTDRLSAIVGEWQSSIWRADEPIQTFGLLIRLNSRLHSDFPYQAREEEGVQSPEEIIIRRTGSCRDFANLFIDVARSLGLAARFVSGYLNAGIPTPYSGATHAWAQVYIPGAGWKGFDPTVGELTGPAHIPVAVACSAVDVPPVSGTYFGSGQATLSVSVEVKQIA